MWNQLGVFGSRVVEAISVTAVETTPTVEATVSSVELLTPAEQTRMEGQDATSLIASRLGVEPGEVAAGLVALHQSGELNGAADSGCDDDADEVVAGEVEVNVNVSLTVGDLEDFERFEKATAAEKLVPVTLKMRPAVLVATPSKPASATPASVNWARGGARGGYGSRGARGVRGRGGRGGGGGGGSRGDASKARGRGGRGGRGKITDLTGGNAESVPDRKGKRKLVEDSISEEAKKVKLMELASDSQLTTVPPQPAAGPSAGPSSKPTPGPSSRPSASASAASSATVSSAASASIRAPKIEASKKKSLLGLLLTGREIDVGKGFGLFD
jgi:hypothetical protein